MAELINKQKAIDVVVEAHCYGTDIMEALQSLSTTTEAEIRNKAINEFFDELQKYEKDDWLKLKMLSIYHIAEQLKEKEQ